MPERTSSHLWQISFTASLSHSSHRRFPVAAARCILDAALYTDLADIAPIGYGVRPHKIHPQTSSVAPGIAALMIVRISMSFPLASLFRQPCTDIAVLPHMRDATPGPDLTVLL